MFRLKFDVKLFHELEYICFVKYRAAILLLARLLFENFGVSIFSEVQADDVVVL